MKRYLFFLSFLLTVCVIAGCSDNNSSPTLKSQKLAIYRNGQSANDMVNGYITASLNDGSFDLYFKTSYDSLKVYSSQGNIAIKSIGHNVCKCIPNHAGSDIILISPVGNDVKDTIYNVHVNIAEMKFAYGKINNISYFVDASDEELKDRVINEMKQSFTTSTYIVAFEYMTKNTGNFYGHYNGSNSGIAFTTKFNTDSINNEKLNSIETYQLTDNKKVWTITVKPNISSTVSKYYSITEDFTKYFQNEYPSKTITKATITLFVGGRYMMDN